MIYSRFSGLPKIVRNFCTNYDAYIVGGCANYLCGDVISYRDIDILVPLSHWPKAQKLIPRGAKHNTYGGSKIISRSVEIDVWADELSNFLYNMTENNFKIVHPRTKSIILVEQKLT